MTTMTARARNSDPATSHYAADSVTNITEVKRRILACYEDGGLTDEALIEKYRQLWGNRHKETDSSIRTRRSELHHAGHVIDTGRTGLTRAGRKSVIWCESGRLW